MTDSEPWRCRRTDGKKWRCYRDVLPDQKYCERHMHRGCRRSRKHVEATETIQKSSNTVINSDNSRPSIISLNNAIADGRNYVAISTSLDLTIPSSNVSKKVAATVKVGSTLCRNRNIEGKGHSIIQDSGASSSSLRNLTGKTNNKYNANSTDERDFSFNHFLTSKIDWRNQGNKNYGDASLVPGFGLSPKSVLLSGFGVGCGSSSCENKTAVELETESLRCRRTDGKKWRCSRGVVPAKKYCETHLYRGAKKTRVVSESASGTPVGFSTLSVEVTDSIPQKVENGINLDTNLSISIASSPQQQMSDRDSSSSSSSDATTVTDENVCVSHGLTLSP